MLTTLVACAIVLWWRQPALALFVFGVAPLGLTVFFCRTIAKRSRVLACVAILAAWPLAYLVSLGPSNMIVPLLQRYPEHPISKAAINTIDFVYAPIISNSFKRRLGELGLLRPYFDYQGSWVDYGVWLFGPTP